MVSNLLGAAGLGGTIGKAIVQLELDSKKYLAEQEAARAKTAASTSKMGSAMQTLGGVGKTAFLGLGVAVAAFGAYSVKAAIESEDALNKLNNTLKNSPRLGDVARQSYIDQANALRDLTGVDDEAIIGAQALLGQFDLTGKQVQRLIPRIVDLSAKMDIDLVAAAKAVGKATQGNTAGLQRYGIVIDEAEGKGSEFASTLKGLSVAAGFAQERADDEPWRVLGAQFEEVAEDLGQRLLPSIKSFAEGLKDLMPVLQFLGQALADLIKLVGDLAQALTLNGNEFDVYSEKLQALTGRFKSGRIDIIEYQKGLRDLQSEYGYTLVVSEEYLNLLHDQQQALTLNARRGAFMADRLREAGNVTARVSDDFEYADATLDGLADATRVSEKAFERYFRTLDRRSRELRRTARELEGEKWIDQDFIDFLSTKGPEWVIQFGNENEREQRRWQRSWEQSNERTNRANENLGAIKDSLDRLDGDTTKHTVEVHYKYIGYDPTKPGMGKSTAR